MTSPSGQSQELPVLPTASDLLKLVIRPAQVIEHPSWNEARDRVISLVTGSPSLIAVLAGLRLPFICTETHELGEEIVASYLYQTFLYDWLDRNGHGRFLCDGDL